MKKLLFLFGLIAACSSYSFAENRLTIDGGEVYDTDGIHYINDGHYWKQLSDESWIQEDCTSLVNLINPDIPFASGYEQETITSPLCVIKKMTNDGEYKPVEGPLPRIEDRFLKPLEHEPLSSISSCSDFSAYAPPVVWSPYIWIISHIGPTSFAIKTKWFGDTMVNSKARYWGTGGYWVETIFFQEIRVSVGNASASVYMSYQGIPLGSSVLGTVC